VLPSMSVNRNVTVPVGNDGVEASACVVEVIESWADRRGVVSRGRTGNPAPANDAQRQRTTG
jgi:hypothetical protein